MKDSKQWSTTGSVVSITSGSCLRLLIVSLAFLAVNAIGQTTFTEQSSLIKAPNAIATIGGDLFGDNVNLYQGGLEFSQTDVSLKGNSQLSVAISRRLITGQQPYLNGKPAAITEGTVVPSQAAKAKSIEEIKISEKDFRDQR